MSNLVKLQLSNIVSKNLPDYTVRESQKAKYLRLKVSVEKGLEVIIPKGYNRQLIPEILSKKQAWLTKAIQSIEEKRRFFAEQLPHILPERITLAAINEEWQIEYLAANSPTSQPILTTQTADHKLIIHGNNTNLKTCRDLLINWLIQKAYIHLLPWLQSVSQSSQLTFSKATIRGQKTRWASCSTHKNISINYKLLFLPSPVVNYVFIHELCHTVQMNHSAAFWELVKMKEPNFKSLDRELDRAWRTVPSWVEVQCS